MIKRFFWRQEVLEDFNPDTSEKIWETTIRRCFITGEGIWAGLNEKLINTALEEKVKLLVVNLIDRKETIEISPQEFKQKSREHHEPSRINLGTTFVIYEFPVIKFDKVFAEE